MQILWQTPQSTSYVNAKHWLGAEGTKCSLYLHYQPKKLIILSKRSANLTTNTTAYTDGIMEGRAQ